jgi:hypothetical protein
MPHVGYYLTMIQDDAKTLNENFLFSFNVLIFGIMMVRAKILPIIRHFS